MKFNGEFCNEEDIMSAEASTFPVRVRVKQLVSHNSLLYAVDKEGYIWVRPFPSGLWERIGNPIENRF